MGPAAGWDLEKDRPGRETSGNKGVQESVKEEMAERAARDPHGTELEQIGSQHVFKSPAEKKMGSKGKSITSSRYNEPAL